MKTHRIKINKTLEFIKKSMPEVFSNASLGIYFKGESFFESFDCKNDSLFDLASLTKVLSTTTLCLLAEQKKTPLHLDTKVCNYFALPSQELFKKITIGHLLNHCSGFPAWLSLHTLFHTPNGIGGFNPQTTPARARRVYEEEILKSFDPKLFETTNTYSDLGFLLLGWILEKEFAITLDALFQQWIAQPFEVKSLQYLPTSPNVVPTENCPWRGHVLRGEVHDDNTYVLGGVAAHAGLFGNIYDVVKLSEQWLKALQGQSSLLDSMLVEKYWNTSINHQTAHRAMGWDKPSPPHSSAGHYFSMQTRGHLGFTGTSLWIDPLHSLIVCLLTNRVYPSRSNEKIKIFRPQFHDSLLTDLGLNSDLR